MGLILLIWGCLALITGGLGRLAAWLFDRRRSWRPLETIWLGWGALILLLQFWHWAFPIDVWTVAAVALLAISGWLLVRPRRFGWRADGTPAQRIGFGAAAVLYALWLANRAGGSIAGVSDAGIYHVPMIRWLNEASLVPGLGNLHGRFAFNNAGFLYHALLEVGPLTHHSFHVAGSFLLLVMGLQLIEATARALGAPGQPDLADYLGVGLLGYGLHLAFIYASSTSPDLAVALLSLVIGLALFRLLFEIRTAQAAEEALCFIVFLAAVGVTVKLSLIAFVGLAAGAAGLRYWQILRAESDRTPRWSILGMTTLAGALVILPWIGRNLTLSGYVVYPGVPWHMDVVWRVPTAQMIDEARWIQSWARQPGVYHGQVLGDWSWVQPWLRTAFSSRIDVTLPLILANVAWLGLVLRRPPGVRSVSVLLWLGTLGGALVFWFLTAPAVRFAGGMLWLLAASGLALHMAGRPTRQRRAFSIALIVLALLIGWYDARQFGAAVPPGPGWLGLHPMPVAETEPYPTASGLVLQTPESGYSCWAAPLPCTPYPSPTLRTVEPGDWRSGFVQSADEVQITWPPAR